MPVPAPQDANAPYKGQSARGLAWMQQQDTHVLCPQELEKVKEKEALVSAANQVSENATLRVYADPIVAALSLRLAWVTSVCRWQTRWRPSRHLKHTSGGASRQLSPV